MGWLARLFGREEVKVKRTRRKKLTVEQQRNLVTDYMINQMKVYDIATKYEVSKSTVYKTINAARRL